jgi:hypothetical protein
MFEALCQLATNADLKSFRVLQVGSEALHPRLMNVARQVAPQAQLWNV